MYKMIKGSNIPLKILVIKHQLINIIHYYNPCHIFIIYKMIKFILILFFAFSIIHSYKLNTPNTIQSVLFDFFQMQQKHHSQDNTLKLNPLCDACHSIFKRLQHFPRQPTLKILEIISTQYCVRKNLQIQKVCQGAVKQMTIYILESAWKHAMDPHYNCHLIRFCPKEYKQLVFEDFKNQLMKNYTYKPQQQSKGNKIANVLHISDVHVDFFYTVGGPAKCDQPVCCRMNVTAKPNSPKAGKWGSPVGDCDLPIQTFNLFLNQISNMNIDFGLWTGDNTAHDIWQQNQDYNNNFTIIISNLLKQKLNVNVYPSSGNHESAPVNVYDFEGKRQNFLNAGLAQAWESWIGSEASNLYKKNGFYSTYIKKYNLKIISLNTQAQNDQNWFLLRDPTDPGGQLKWLISQLNQAEKTNKFVYIIGHIHPQSGLRQWTNRYNVIVNRYAYNIRGQYFGHSHEESISFFNHLNGSEQIINTLLVDSSLTTYSDKLPEFRVLKVDLETMRLLDYDQYILHLERELPQNPKFELFYSFLKEYNLKDFSFKSQLEFQHALRDDPATQIKFTYLQGSGLRQGHSGKSVYCDTMATGDLVDKCNGNVHTPSLFDKVAGPWKQLITKE